jgi:ribonuclease BN (tRNA processing enzyme)
MKITILGSGTCVPSLIRSSCAVLVHIGGDNLLFDIGPGTMCRLMEAGIGIHDISHVFLSHFHPDHTGELVSFLFANKYPDENRRTIPLDLCGGTGLKAFFDQLKSIYTEWIDLSGRLRLLEFANTGRDVREFDSFIIETCPANHRPESIACRVTAPNGSTMVYSGDTDYSEDLIGLAENADVFICECALPDTMKVTGHLTPSLAGKMAAAANVKKLVLTHFYPPCEDADIEAQCRKTYAGPLALAHDLMTFDLENAS